MHIPFECFQLDTCYPCSTRRYDRCIPLHYTAHFVSNKTKCRARNMYSRPVNLREDLRQPTSLSSYRFVEYMNTIGWHQDGVFLALLATVGYSFHDKKGLLVPRKWDWRGREYREDGRDQIAWKAGASRHTRRERKEGLFLTFEGGTEIRLKVPGIVEDLLA